MVMKPEPIYLALEKVKNDHKGKKTATIYLTPQGELLKQKRVDSLLEYDNLVLFCGHYEDIDYRARKLFDYEISIGDYVLSGGEPAAVVLVDAVTRKIPGALGNPESSAADSFSAAENLFDCPHFTRPPVWRGKHVPDVLLSGEHKGINIYRRAKAILNTLKVRPDLLRLSDLNKEDYKILKEYFKHYHCYDE